MFMYMTYCSQIWKFNTAAQDISHTSQGPNLNHSIYVTVQQHPAVTSPANCSSSINTLMVRAATFSLQLVTVAVHILLTGWREN
jgi:undecaprenyl pyrophosphate phosphatase UppP